MGNSRDSNPADPSNSMSDLSDTSSTKRVDAIVLEETNRQIIDSTHGESYCIEVLRGPTKGDLIFLDNETNTFGRDYNCNVLLDDITVSRHHCEIALKDGDIILTDTGSTNGTYVNSKPVESCSIETGDVIQIGKFVFALARRTKK